MAEAAFASQDELVTSAKARRLLGWTPHHISFTDDPARRVTRHLLTARQRGQTLDAPSPAA
jgi:hypothetical protein